MTDYLGGFPLLTTVIVLGLLVVLYFTQTLDLSAQGSIAVLDDRLLNAVAGWRSTALIRVFADITIFGSWLLIFLMAAAASLFLWISARTRYLPGLWLALLGNQLSVTLLKSLFARPRPALATYLETSGSFPSGHSAASAVLFGFLAYVAVQERIVPPAIAILFGGAAILLIGLSRLILGEHYLSDVCGGYLVGMLWVLIGIWFSNLRVHVPPPPRTVSRWYWLELAAIILATLFAMYFLAGNAENRMVALPATTAQP